MTDFEELNQRETTARARKVASWMDLVRTPSPVAHRCVAELAPETGARWGDVDHRVATGSVGPGRFGESTVPCGAAASPNSRPTRALG